METPCKDCTLRFPACWDHCPKDENGGYGYKAWLAEKHKKQDEIKAWKQNWYDSYKRSDEGKWKYKKGRK